MLIYAGVRISTLPGKGATKLSPAAWGGGVRPDFAVQNPTISGIDVKLHIIAEIQPKKAYSQKYHYF